MCGNSGFNRLPKFPLQVSHGYHGYHGFVTSHGYAVGCVLYAGQDLLQAFTVTQLEAADFGTT